MEGIAYMIFSGLIIGILISAPMGPVGVLCIQRTLNKGRWAGFFTGIGAAISDILYCLLAGFGLSFIENFLNRHQNIIQILGSIVLIGFGIYQMKSNPSKQLRKNNIQKTSAKTDILTGFLFTFSNPLILFLIIGLFARFNFLSSYSEIYHTITGFLFIFIGAIVWWYIVTFFVNKIRAHFNLRSMWLINRITGSIMLVFALVGIITGISSIISQL